MIFIILFFGFCFGHRLFEQPPVTLGELEHWGRYAAAAYDEFEDWGACGRCQATEALRQTTVVAQWSTTEPGAFSRGFVGVNHRRRQAVVAFRGTTHVMDTVTDARVLQRRWPASVNGSRVHSGFLAAYGSARAHVRGVDGYALAFVGHSLGGAQAVLAAADFCAARACDHVTLVTFGAPRVGNGAFAAHANAVVGASWRVVHGADAVAQVPRTLGPAEGGLRRTRRAPPGCAAGSGACGTIWSTQESVY
ncbi:hypothetical protein GGI06_005493 [Coemansia sp. S85]|nr:hypothetical protein GGI06_005493 [Coemansia sp. S85]